MLWNGLAELNRDALSEDPPDPDREFDVEEPPKRDPPREALLPMREFRKSEPPCVDAEPAEPKDRDAPEVPPAKFDEPLENEPLDEPPFDAPLDEPNERKPPGLPALREERLEFVKPPELPPALRPAAELPPPNECHWPSLIAERAFDERLPPEPKPPLEPKLRLPPLDPKLRLFDPNPPLRLFRPRDEFPPNERLPPKVLLPLYGFPPPKDRALLPPPKDRALPPPKDRALPPPKDRALPPPPP
jgi:hypothetical protein